MSNPAEVKQMSAPKINVTPLIDVLLVLLIIFMVVAPIKPRSFTAKLPNESILHPTAQTDPHALVVNIASDGSISLNNIGGLGTPDDTVKLTENLRSIFAERRQNGAVDVDGNVLMAVFIRAPRNIEYGKVVKVIDAVKMAGAEPIALELDRLD
jgi:biopolymer transport protein ExbD